MVELLSGQYPPGGGGGDNNLDENKRQAEQKGHNVKTAAFCCLHSSLSDVIGISKMKKKRAQWCGTSYVISMFCRCPPSSSADPVLAFCVLFAPSLHSHFARSIFSRFAVSSVSERTFEVKRSLVRAHSFRRRALETI